MYKIVSADEMKEIISTYTFIKYLNKNKYLNYKWEFVAPEDKELKYNCVAINKEHKLVRPLTFDEFVENLINEEGKANG